MNISSRFTDLTKEEFSNYFLFVNFMEIFDNLSFFNSSDLGFVCSFWLVFCPLDSDPHTSADLDPGIQNIADPTDPDPKNDILL